MNKRLVGSEYEQIAREYLVKHNYKIVEMNYRCRVGEIDCIAREAGYLVFLEVKYRRNGSMGSAVEAVDVRKQRQIRRTAQAYLIHHHLGEDTPCRFDVLGIDGGEFTLIKDAY